MINARKYPIKGKGVRYSKLYQERAIKYIDVSAGGDNDYQLQQWKIRDYKGRPIYRTVWVLYKKIGWRGDRNLYQKISGDFPNLQMVKKFVEQLAAAKEDDGIWTSINERHCECNFCRGVEKRRVKKCKGCGKEICHCDTYCARCLEKINGPKEMPIDGKTIYEAASKIADRLYKLEAITKEEYDILRLVIEND